MSRAPVLRLWGWPVALGLASAIGLVAALLADDVASDLASAAALGLPLGVALRCIVRRPAVAARRKRHER